MGPIGRVIVLALVMGSYSASAGPSLPCRVSTQMEFVTDDVDICGYYLCNGGVFMADPVSKIQYMPCAPGTSTKLAERRSVHTPCTTIDMSCGGRDGEPGPTVYPERNSTTSRTFTSRATRMHVSSTIAPPYPVGPDKTIYSQPVEVFMNAHVSGGRHLVAIRIDDGPVMAVTSRNLCHRACDMNATCVAFDWDAGHASCWVHTERTACGNPEPQAEVQHVRVVKCIGEAHTAQPHYPETSSTTASRPAPTTTMFQDWSVPGQARAEFVEQYPDHNAIGGRLVLTKSTLDGCLAYCGHFMKCEAVDFDSLSETCWLHEADTACGNLVPKNGCTHYKRVSCHNNDLAPRFLASFQGSHVDGGSPLCDGCTLTQCQHRCLHHQECAGADYNSLEATCYGHLAETVCNPLQKKQGCTHFRRLQCQI